MKRLLLVLAVAASLGLVGTATSAPAPARWTATITPAAGDDDTPMDLLASGGCPAPATNVLGKVYGKGLPADGVVVVGNTAAGVSATDPVREPLAMTMRDVVRDQPTVVALSGSYQVVLTCRLPSSVHSYGEYVASIRFTSPTSYVAERSPGRSTGPLAPKDEAAPGGGPATGAGPAPGQSGRAGAGAPQGVPSGSGARATAATARAAADRGSPGNRPLFLGAALVVLIALAATAFRRFHSPSPSSAER